MGVIKKSRTLRPLARERESAACRVGSEAAGADGLLHLAIFDERFHDLALGAFEIHSSEVTCQRSIHSCP